MGPGPSAFATIPKGGKRTFVGGVMRFERSKCDSYGRCAPWTKVCALRRELLFAALVEVCFGRTGERRKRNRPAPVAPAGSKSVQSARITTSRARSSMPSLPLHELRPRATCPSSTTTRSREHAPSGGRLAPQSRAASPISAWLPPFVSPRARPALPCADLLPPLGYRFRRFEAYAPKRVELSGDSGVRLVAEFRAVVSTTE